MAISDDIRSLRNTKDMNQNELAHHSGVSYATIQAIEADRGNPSLETLQKILGVFNCQLAITSKEPDWDTLCTLGVPLTANKKVKIKKSLENLIKHLDLACQWLLKQGDCREKDAIRAVILALQCHFPQAYYQALEKLSIAKLNYVEAQARHIKLRRIAIRNLADYL